MGSIASDAARFDEAGSAIFDRSTLTLPWILLALTPAIMAVATWGPQNYHYAVQVWMRFFSWPALIIEAVVIGMALAKGVRLFAMLRIMPAMARVSLSVVVAIALGTTIFVAPDAGSSVLRTSATLVHICFGLSVAGLVAQMPARFDREIWQLIVGGLLIYALLLFVYVARIRDAEQFDWVHFGLAVSNIRFVGFFMLVGACASMAFASIAESRRSYWGWILATTVFTALMFWSGSRNPVLAFSIACVLGTIAIGTVRARKVAIGWFTSIVGGGAVSMIYVPPSPIYGLYRMFSSIGADSADGVSSGRLVIWEGGLRVFAQKPLFGFGEGQFIHVVPEALSIYHHPHNLVVQFLVQWGAIGAICALTLLIWGWWWSMRCAQESTERMLPAFLVLTGLGAASFFDGIFFFVYPSMTVALTMALALGPLIRKRQDGHVIGR